MSAVRLGGSGSPDTPLGQEPEYSGCRQDEIRCFLWRNVVKAALAAHEQQDRQATSQCHPVSMKIPPLFIDLTASLLFYWI